MSDMVAHVCNLDSWEAEAKHCGEFKVTLSYVIFVPSLGYSVGRCFKTRNERKRKYAILSLCILLFDKVG